MSSLGGRSSLSIGQKRSFFPKKPSVAPTRPPPTTAVPSQPPTVTDVSDTPDDDDEHIDSKRVRFVVNGIELAAAVPVPSLLSSSLASSSASSTASSSATVKKPKCTVKIISIDDEEFATSAASSGRRGNRAAAMRTSEDDRRALSAVPAYQILPPCFGDGAAYQLYTLYLRRSPPPLGLGLRLRNVQGRAVVSYLCVVGTLESVHVTSTHAKLFIISCR